MGTQASWQLQALTSSVQATHQGAEDLAEVGASTGERQQWVPEQLWVDPG